MPFTAFDYLSSVAPAHTSQPSVINNAAAQDLAMSRRRGDDFALRVRGWAGCCAVLRLVRFAPVGTL